MFVNTGLTVLTLRLKEEHPPEVESGKRECFSTCFSLRNTWFPYFLRRHTLIQKKYLHHTTIYILGQIWGKVLLIHFLQTCISHGGNSWYITTMPWHCGWTTYVQHLFSAFIRVRIVKLKLILQSDFINIFYKNDSNLDNLNFELL